jgi:hypothetical protein
VIAAASDYLVKSSEDSTGDDNRQTGQIERSIANLLVTCNMEFKEGCNVTGKPGARFTNV